LIGPHRAVAAPAGARADILAIQGLVADKLALVDIELQRNLGSEVGIIDELGAYLAAGGGKRIRPLLLLLAAGLAGYRGSYDAKLAAVFEFIHNATLVHDDIIDEADTRRGRDALCRVYGNELAVLMGDYLYIRAMNMALEAGRIEIIRILASATQKMIEGEIMAHHSRRRLDIGADQHLEIVRRKTAHLFSGCCEVAAVLGELEGEPREALSSFGMDLGVTFQLVDDLLDLTADTETLGKPAASDLREGRLTLPVIHLLAQGDPEHRLMVRTVVEERGFRSVPEESFLDLVSASGGLEVTRDLPELVLERDR
jgi:octaprenyl-diphosphate synthase